MAEGADDPSRRSRLLLVGGLAALAGVHLVGARRDPLLAGDEAWYVGLARSLGEGGGYTLDGLPHAVYPPGLPLVLVPAVERWGVDPPTLFAYATVWSLVCLLAVAVWLRSRPDVARAAPYLWFVLASVAVFDVFTDLRSEGLFLGVWGLLFALLEVGARPPGRTGRTIPLWATAGAALLLGAALPAVRTIGVALPAALGVALVATWFRRERPPRAWVVGAASALAGGVLYQLWWKGRTLRFDHDRAYGSLLTMVDPHEPDLGTAGPLQLVERVFDQTAVQLGHGVEILTNVTPLHPFLFGTPQVALALLVGAGVVVELRRPNPVAGWFLLAYGAILALWPFDEGTRFLVPVLPLLLLFVVRGAATVWDARPATPEGWRRLAVRLVLLAGVAAAETLARSPGSRQGWAWVIVWAAAAAGVWVAAPRLVRLPSRPLARWAPAWGVVFLLLGVPGLVAGVVLHRAGVPKFQSDRLAGAVAWIDARTDSSAILASTDEAQGLHLHTRRRVRLVPTTADPHRLWTALDTARVRYLVVPADHEYPYLRPTGDARVEALEAARPGALDLVHAWPMGRVFEVRPP